MATRRNDDHVMAYVMVPDRATARAIARILVEGRLAASANLWPAESVYRWKGKVEAAREYVVVAKTRRRLARKLVTAVRAAHPYEVPCIVTYAMDDALPTYAAWIDASTA